MFSRSLSLFRPISKRIPILATSPNTSLLHIPHRHLSTTITTTTTTTDPLQVRLTAPNGLQYTQPTGLFINNTWTPSSTNTSITSINPTAETEITTVHAASETDIDHAVSAARKAFNGPWRDIHPSERGALLYKLSQLVEEHRDVLATIETWDNGKPYAVARDEDITEVVGTLRYYAGWADKISGQVLDSGLKKLAYTVREPVGVCGLVIPWNYPLGMAAWKYVCCDLALEMGWYGC